MNNILDSINTIMRTLVLLLFATISFRGYSQTQPTLILPDYDQYEACIGLSFNPQKTLYYNLNSSGVLKFYESSTKKLVHLIGSDSLQVTQAIFVEEKRVLISAFSNSRKNKNLDTYRVYLFDLETSEIIYVFKEVNLKGDLNKSKNGEQLYKFEPFEYSFLDFNKSKSLISIRYGEKLEVWNLQTLEIIKKFKNVNGISEFSTDGEFIVAKDEFYGFDNIMPIVANKKAVSNNKEKGKSLKNALSVEVILKYNIALIGTKNGELLVKDLKNWETIKVISLFDSWLQFIQFDEVSGNILTYGLYNISDDKFTSYVKILNAKSLTLENEFEVLTNRYFTNWFVNSIARDIQGNMLFLNMYRGYEDSQHYHEGIDLNSKNSLFSSVSYSKFNENNLSPSAVLIPGRTGAQFISKGSLYNKIDNFSFYSVFLSPNDRIIAQPGERYRNVECLFVWDLFSGRSILSDSIAVEYTPRYPLGFDSLSQKFIYGESHSSKGLNHLFNIGDSLTDIDASKKIKPEINQENNLTGSSFLSDTYSYDRFISDTCRIDSQNRLLIFEKDTSNATTVKLIDVNTNLELWQKRYEADIVYKICDSGKILFLDYSKKYALDLIVLENGESINVSGSADYKFKNYLQEYRFSPDSEWLVVEKSRKEFDDLYEFEFWNISQKKKIFGFTSLTDINSVSIVVDKKLNRFISNHSGQFNYYSLLDGTKLGKFDLDLEYDFSGNITNENTFWLTDDSKFLIVADGSSPNKVSVYDNATLKKLYTRIQSPDGNWIAFDKDLNYDGSEGALSEVYYVKGLQVLSDYVPEESKHIPGLIEKIMSH